MVCNHLNAEKGTSGFRTGIGRREHRHHLKRAYSVPEQAIVAALTLFYLSLGSNALWWLDVLKPVRAGVHVNVSKRRSRKKRPS